MRRLPRCLPPPPPPTSRLVPPPKRPPKNIRAGAACTRTAWLRAWLLSELRQAAAEERAAARATAAQAMVITRSAM